MRLRSMFAVAMLTSAFAARADDGILYSFGAPKLMHGESTIRMVTEFVSAKVYRDHANVYCRFVLRNFGRAVNARIGFPDGSDHAYQDDEKPEPDLDSFRSDVDGKRVATRIEYAPLPVKDAALYHVKTVRFGAHQTRIVEDWYSGSLSGGGTDALAPSDKSGAGNLYVSQFEYVMASGGSWKGNISKATLQVRFTSKHLQHLHAVPDTQFGHFETPTRLKRMPPRNLVTWSGFAKPRFTGNRMVFTRKNFKPTAADDVSLSFDWLPFDNSLWARG